MINNRINARFPQPMSNGRCAKHTRQQGVDRKDGVKFFMHSNRITTSREPLMISPNIQPEACTPTAPRAVRPPVPK
jgi:hypothetical protein